MANRALGLIGKTYIALVSLAGSIAILLAILSLAERPIGLQWLFLAALTLLGGLFTVRIPSVPATVSISETFVFLTVLLFGTAPAVLSVALEGFLISLWRYRQRPSRILFNTFEAPVSLWIASTAFFAFVVRDSSGLLKTDVGHLLLPLFGLAFGYFLLNSCLMAIAVALETRVSAFSIWSKHFLWLSIDYFGGASIAMLLFLASAKLTVTTLAIVTPILIICYLTFRLATDRVEDATRHLKELNTLYISTIETLASAIDAKDQITHGHIRRVQKHAVTLAKRLGVREEPLIRAIEAAALLHDMGKLAIPEYILNKPGRLTDAEFEKMKAHASVGAEILAGVNFPYPVVPIVRHHHEYWDGSGYPDGLKGADIPIGARILAVVDCFDALTSDRPYRPKLNRAAAIEILKQRAGTMYDPLVVDAFVEMQSEISSTADGVDPAGSPASTASLVHESTAALSTIASSSGEMLALYQLATELAGCRTITGAAPAVARELRRLIPAELILVFRPDDSQDEMVVIEALGDRGADFLSFKLAFGKGLSGWVGANKRTILNSDPILDFGDGIRALVPVLRSCLSVPVLVGGSVLGVISAYSSKSNAFSEDHARMVEAVSGQVARFIGKPETALTGADDLRIDPLTGAFAAGILEEEIVSLVVRSPDQSGRLELFFIDISDLASINVTYGKKAGDLVLRLTVESLRRSLPTDAVICRLGGDDFICLVTARHDASSFVERLTKHVRDAGQETGIPFVVTVASSSLLPESGREILETVKAIRTQAVPLSSWGARAQPGVH